MYNENSYLYEIRSKKGKNLFGLDLIMAGVLSLSPTPVVAQVECHAKVAPKISVLPSKSNVQYDFTKTKPELNNIDVDTVSPYGPNHKTYVSGLMSGSIKVENQVSFMMEEYEQLGLGCIYLRTIEVNIHIDPTVFIAKEYPPGSCMHEAVLGHEHKHVREDQLIVNKYANLIGQAMASVVNAQGPAFGPFEKSKLPLVQKNLQESLNSVVKKYNDKMNQERQRRQQAIDSLEEYESIGSHCKKGRR